MIRCLKCMEIYEMLLYHQIEIDDLEPQVLIAGFKGDELICDKCAEVLEPKEYYFSTQDDIDDFEEKALSRIAEVISEKIDYCSHCDGYELERCRENINQELQMENLDDDDFSDYVFQDGMDAYDFLCNQEISEQYRDIILEKLKCSSCGYGGTYGESFDILDRFYTKEEIDRFYGVDYDSLTCLARNCGIYLEKREVKDFEELLYNNPLLGYYHETGKKIYNLLNENFNHFKVGIYVIPSGTEIYRGRTRKKDSEHYQLDKLWNPPEGTASQGRYNSAGISVLYCCQDKNKIPYEIHPKYNEVIDIGKFVVKKDLRLLDIDDLFEKFTGFVGETTTEDKILKKAYLLTNYIRDCCQLIGYNGVKYKGAGGHTYCNFAFFNFEKYTDIQITDVLSVDYQILYNPKPN